MWSLFFKKLGSTITYPRIFLMDLKFRRFRIPNKEYCRTHLDSDVSVQDVTRVQHDGTALVQAIVFGGDVLDQQSVDVLDESVTVLNPGVFLVPVDQWCGIGLDFAPHFVTSSSDRVLFGRSVHPRDVVLFTQKNQNNIIYQQQKK